jgi:hypothetical protein
MGQIIKYDGMSRLTQDDLRAFVTAAAIIDVHPDWLGAVMQFESGFNPQAVNPYSNATGLIQFMPPTASKLGTSVSALKGMNFVQQLEYVIKYFGEKAALRSLDDTYLKVFYPAAIGKANDYVVSREGEVVYAQNKGFDTGNKGYITKNDITSTIHSVYNKGQRNGYITIDSPLA